MRAAGAAVVDDCAVAEVGETHAAVGAPGDRAGAAEFAQLAMELHDVDGVDETVEAVVHFAVQALQCTAAGVALVTGRGRPEALTSTDPRVAELHRLQIEADEGPMIAAIRPPCPVVIGDVETETRWSADWIAQARAAGIRSAAHLPLLVEGRAAAVLSLYGDGPDGFGADDLAVAHILARHASVAIATARQEETLAQAIDARKLVGQAMGILMERYDLDPDRAFEVLKRYSQQHNRKLRDVAQELIDTRQLPARTRGTS
jgi:GAF domain-containing protein